MGITPACAGTTTVQPVDVIADGDHPRVCGNHTVCRELKEPA